MAQRAIRSKINQSSLAVSTTGFGESQTDPVWIKSTPISGPDNIYCSITIRGNNTGQPNQPHKTFTFDERFSEPFIRNIENYYLSIVSVAFPACEVPLAIINNIVPGSTQNDPNLTDWVFCFTYNNINYPLNVEYIPYNAMPVPSPPSANSPDYVQQHTSYYFVENYNVLLHMFNQTLVTIYTSMRNANLAAFGVLGLGATDYPYFIYDEINDRFKLIYNKLYIGSGIQLFYSDTVSVFFPGFFSYYYGTGLANGKDYLFQFENYNGNTFDTTHNVNSQQYSGSASYLNPMSQILITSNNLRTAFEFTADDNPNNDYSQSNVIFSLTPLLETPAQEKSKLVYVTNGTYRLVDIVGQGYITQLDFNVYWTDNIGTVYPISIPSGLTGVAKIIFIKKTLKTNAY
jgi:hypothetical protein